jgi:hypothetical protein
VPNAQPAITAPAGHQFLLGALQEHILMQSDFKHQQNVMCAQMEKFAPQLLDYILK